MTYREHILELAAELGVVVYQTAPDFRYSIATYLPIYERYTDITVPPITGEDEYWAALHELGHCATSDLSRGSELRAALTTGRRWGYTPPCQLESESNAWHWALDNALHPPSVGAIELIRTLSINQYRSTADGDTPRYLELLERLS
jgi:hypothetical protein